MPSFIVTGNDRDTGLMGTLTCEASSQADAAAQAAAKGLVPLSILAAGAAGPVVAENAGGSVKADEVATGVTRGAFRIFWIVFAFFILLLPGVGLTLASVSVAALHFSGNEVAENPNWIALGIAGVLGLLLTWAGYSTINDNQRGPKPAKN